MNAGSSAARGLSALLGRTEIARLEVHHDNRAAIRPRERSGRQVHHLHGQDMTKRLNGEENR